ncbi:HesA/MoeB/ThiF family protein [Clostridium sediminicola]
MVVAIERYSRNQNSITREENIVLKNSSVCIIGCGGLGGYIIETLARIGIGLITVVDGDTFDISNLNRQLLSDEESIGFNKALIAKNRMSKVNSEIKVIAIPEMLTETNGMDIINNHDVVIDALDSIKTRLLLDKLCEKANIPLVHGSIGGWYGQVATIYPGDGTLRKIYKEGIDKGMEVTLGNLSFVAANIASIEASEAVKVILNKGVTLRNKLLVIDFLDMEQQIIDLK